MRVIKATYREDRKSFGAFILSEGMRSVTYDVTKDIAAAARANAPRGDEDDGSHHADKYVAIREAGTLKVERNLRVMCKVVNDDPIALMNEFGNINTKRERTLGRTGALFGDFKPEGGPG